MKPERQLKILAPGRSILVFLVVSLVMLWIGALTVVLTERELVLKASEAEALKLAQIVVQETSGLLLEARSSLKLLDDWLQVNPEADPRSDPRFLGLAASLRAGFQTTVDLRVISDTGELYDLGAGARHYLGVGVSDREYVQVQQNPATRGFFLGHPIIGRASRTWGLPVSYPLTSRNKHTIVLLALVDLTRLNRSLEAYRPQPDGVITLVRNDGLILDRVPFDASLMGQSAAGEPWWSSRGDGPQRLSLGSLTQPWQVVFRPAEGLPFGVVVENSFQGTLGSWSGRLIFALTILLVVTALMGGWGVVLLRSWKQLAASEHEKGLLAEELGRSTEIYGLIAEQSNDVVAILTVPELTYEYVNPALTRQRGWTADEVLGLSPDHIDGPERLDHLRKTMGPLVRRLEAGDPSARFGTVEVDLAHKDGHLVPYELVMTLLTGPSGKVEKVLTLARNISERRVQEFAMRKLAFHDQLTGLPNRRLLEDRLDQALARGAREAVGGALLFVDLDRFKPVNDELGHATGDWLLQQVARRMESATRSCDTVARFGGDEFVVLLIGASGARDALTVAEKIRSVVIEPYSLDDETLVTISASIGVVLFPDHGTRREQLLKLSDMAMYQAKGQGRDQVRLYQPDTSEPDSQP